MQCLPVLGTTTTYVVREVKVFILILKFQELSPERFQLTTRTS